MKRIKIDRAEEIIKDEKNKEDHIDYFYNWKGKPMVKIGGNFFGFGFRISKNKLKTIFKLMKVLKPFTKGEYDNRLEKLPEDTALKT